MDRLLSCQEDAYLWRTESLVLACEAAADGQWLVTAQGSPFYPQGGGQPSDHGLLGGVAVVDVQRGPDGKILHTTVAPVDLGQVQAQVDGVRRFDFMQQHTAQHLITAIAQDRFERSTTSFHLGQRTSSIDLDGPLTSAQVRQLEVAVNAEIRADHSVRARVVDRATYATLGVRSRGLPTGHSGPVRLVEIQGLDLNTCGGTHVSRLGELQLVHLLGTEKVRGGARLSYVAGGRSILRMRASTARSGELNKLLKCGVDDHTSSVKRLLEDAKQAGRARRALMSELGVLLGQHLAASGTGCLHRPESDLGLLRAIADACAAAGGPVRLLLTGGESDGVFLLVAPDPVLKAVSSTVLDLLKARGGGRGGRMQGKSTDLSARMAAWDVIAGA